MTSSAYIIGVSVAVILLIVAAIVAMMISFKPDNSDCKARKLWFWILGILTPVVTFISGYLFVYNDIKVPSQKSEYLAALGIGVAISFVLYVVLGFVLSKINKHGKIGNWF